MNTSAYIDQILSAFKKGEKLNITHLRKLGKAAGLTDNDRYLMELAELAWTKYYRIIVENSYKDTDWSVLSTYQKVVDFYKKVQPSYTVKDSTKRIFQQYSTAAPIGYLMGWFCDEGLEEPLVFEPSAGNGLLTIYYDEPNVSVNELDKIRRTNLEGQGYAAVTSMDASVRFPASMKHQYDVIITNPPFGKLGETDRTFGYPFKEIDHIMVAVALETMRDTGRAAILIGNHTEYNDEGRIKSFRAFFDYLHRYFNVATMINIDAAKLYSKQGTSFDLRCILINGRKKQPIGYAPTKAQAPEYELVVDDFEGLYERVEAARNRQFITIEQQLGIYKTQLSL